MRRNIPLGALQSPAEGPGRKIDLSRMKRSARQFAAPCSAGVRYSTSGALFLGQPCRRAEELVRCDRLVVRRAELAHASCLLDRSARTNLW